jgi:hypothetical protein
MTRHGWSGTLQNGIRERRDIEEVTLPDLLVVGDVTKWYERKVRHPGSGIA